MDAIDRRRLMMMGGALLLGGRAWGAEAPASPPRASLPANWRRAETIPLWPGQPPGAAGFRVADIARRLVRSLPHQRCDSRTARLPAPPSERNLGGGHAGGCVLVRVSGQRGRRTCSLADGPGLHGVRADLSSAGGGLGVTIGCAVAGRTTRRAHYPFAGQPFPHRSGTGDGTGIFGWRSSRRDARDASRAADLRLRGCGRCAGCAAVRRGAGVSRRDDARSRGRMPCRATCCWAHNRRPQRSIAGPPSCRSMRTRRRSSWCMPWMTMPCRSTIRCDS